MYKQCYFVHTVYSLLNTGIIAIGLYSSQQFVFVVTLVFNRTSGSIGSYSHNAPSNLQNVLLGRFVRYCLSLLYK